MSHNPLEVPDIERRASERAARSRKLRVKGYKEGEIFFTGNVTAEQTEFLELFSACSYMSLKNLCKQLKIRPSTVEAWKKESQAFRRELTLHYNRTLQATNMSRKQVMKGLLEAIDMAVDQKKPSTMIIGWKEIGRMCGFYEPERREISLSVQSEAILEEIRTISRDKLLELAQEQDVIEGQYVRTATKHP